MIDPMITAFFAERKKGWLTDKIKERLKWRRRIRSVKSFLT